MKKVNFVLLMALLFIHVQCRKELVPGVPEILSVSDITHNSAMVVSELTSPEYGINIISKGICIDKSKIPVFTGSSFNGIIIGGGAVKCLTGVSGLEPGTRYNIRAWFEIDTKTVYSETVQIETKPVEYLVDPRDRQEYPVKRFGDQWWMLQNLNYISPGSVTFQSKGKDFPSEFGRLYPYPEAVAACPTGWRLPSDEDWKALEINIGINSGDLDKNVQRGSPCGGKMKEPGMRLWDSDNAGHSTNETGFSVVPAGWYNVPGNEFTYQAGYAGFWCKGDGPGHSYCRIFYSSSDGICRFYSNTNEYKYSIRCVK